MKINKDIIARDIQGDTVFLNMITGDYYSLNSVGTDIYNCITEEMKIDAIVKRLADKYNVETAQLNRDILDLIADLKENGIIDD